MRKPDTGAGRHERFCTMTDVLIQQTHTYADHLHPERHASPPAPRPTGVWKST